MSAVIDLRSDTVTQPTPEMRRAIADAAVGDEQKREDPTVSELQTRVAQMLGQEEALFVPTATMANQIALKLHSRPGDVLLAEETSHVLVYEYGGAAAHSGLMSHGLAGSGGCIFSEQIRDAAAPSTKVADQRVAVVSLENTHNNAGVGVAARRARGCRRNLARARAGGASRRRPASQCLDRTRRHAGDYRFPFRHGHALPLQRPRLPTRRLARGLAGTDRACLAGKHVFGGAMRQAGIVAAAGVYALDHHVERLAEDHARARRLAEALVEAGLAVDLERVETNFVQLDLEPLGLDRTAALASLRDAGVSLSATIHPKIVRAVTHLEITDEDVERAAELIPQALGVRVVA